MWQQRRYLIGTKVAFQVAAGSAFASKECKMYQKAEISRVKQAFWTTFGQYMKPVLSADQQPVNWINYKTGFRHLYFRMDALNTARIGIDISQPDKGIQQLYYDQFLLLKGMFEETIGEEWTWRPPAVACNAGIFRQLDGYSIMNKENWPYLISFFKQRIIALDAFWSQAKYAFESLL